MKTLHEHTNQTNMKTLYEHTNLKMCIFKNYITSESEIIG